jgi:hypothetical protein
VRSRGYAPLSDTAESRDLVERIVAHARRVGAGHVAGFDLDGCLFDTRPRQVHIFRELSSLRGWPWLAEVRAEHFRDWSLRNTMREAGIAEAKIAAHYEEVRDYWHRCFFRGAYVLHDHAMPGAAELVRAVIDAGLEVVYLTGRDTPGMRTGTEEALRRFGFPYDRPGATLLTKPTFEMDDTAFKKSAIEEIGRLGKVAIYMDNEPANVNLFASHFPSALVVFVETDHSPKPDVPGHGIPWLRSFLA